MFRYFTILFLLLRFTVCWSQARSNEFETSFAWQVKQIDEFIERFNDTDTTFISEYLKSHGQQTTFTRERSLISLFNAEGKNWNISEVKDFISEVDNKQKPQYISFFDSTWCAKVHCLVRWKGKPENAVLTLKVQKFRDGSSKWVITGVSAKFLSAPAKNDTLANLILRTIPPALDSTTSFHPYSHATGFMNIAQVSADKPNIRNYFLIPAAEVTDDLLVFIHEIVNNKLIVKQATSISYQFFQVKGWVFEVREYDRPSRNSGWLISKLIKVSDKKQYDE